MTTRPEAWREMSVGLVELLTKKAQAYGDSFSRAGEILKVLYPLGLPPGKYHEVLVMARVIDKMFRIANTPVDGLDSMGEDPWQDIEGYALLERERRARMKDALKDPK